MNVRNLCIIFQFDGFCILTRVLMMRGLFAFFRPFHKTCRIFKNTPSLVYIYGYTFLYTQTHIHTQQTHTYI